MFSDQHKHYYMLSRNERKALLSAYTSLILGKLQSIRKRRNISAEQVCAFFDKESIHWIRTREQGKTVFTLKDFIEMCLLYEISMADFFNGLEPELMSELTAISKFSGSKWNDRANKMKRIGTI